MTKIFVLFALLCLVKFEFCGGIQIFVKMASGKRVALEVKRNDSVGNLKKEIQEVEGIPIGRQQLMYSGRELKYGRILDEYDIKNGATIQLVSRSRAGRDLKLYVQMELTLSVNSSDTVRDLKNEILNNINAKNWMRKLVFDKLQHDELGYLRDDKKTIASSGLRDLDILHVGEESRAPRRMPRDRETTRRPNRTASSASDDSPPQPQHRNIRFRSRDEKYPPRPKQKSIRLNRSGESDAENRLPKPHQKSIRRNRNREEDEENRPRPKQKSNRNRESSASTTSENRPLRPHQKTIRRNDIREPSISTGSESENTSATAASVNQPSLPDQRNISVDRVIKHLNRIRMPTVPPPPQPPRPRAKHLDHIRKPTVPPPPPPRPTKETNRRDIIGKHIRRANSPERQPRRLDQRTIRRDKIGEPFNSSVSENTTLTTEPENQPSRPNRPHQKTQKVDRVRKPSISTVSENTSVASTSVNHPLRTDQKYLWRLRKGDNRLERIREPSDFRKRIGTHPSWRDKRE